MQTKGKPYLIYLRQDHMLAVLNGNVSVGIILSTFGSKNYITSNNNNILTLRLFPVTFEFHMLFVQQNADIRNSSQGYKI
jgi:hypothetical protein